VPPVNLLPDPGFDLLDPRWVPNTAELLFDLGIELSPPVLAYCYTVPEGIGHRGGSMTWDDPLPVQVGDIVDVSGWGWAPFGEGTGWTQAFVSQGGGPFTEVGPWFDPAASWTALPWGLVEVTALPFLIRFGLRANVPDPMHLLLDDLAVMLPEDLAMQNRWDAHLALINRLKTITGTPTYHLNLANRVFPRLFVPGEETASLLPYLCVPLYGDAPRYETGERGHTLMRWRVNIHGFVHEGSQTYDVCEAHRDCLHLHDDVLKCLMGDPTLGGKARLMEVADGGGAVAGVDDLPWGEFVIPLELMMAVGLDVLGP